MFNNGMLSAEILHFYILITKYDDGTLFIDFLIVQYFAHYFQELSQTEWDC